MFQSNGPSIFTQSFAGRVLDELSPEGSLYDERYSYGQEKSTAPHHHVTKRGGSVGYGGVYSPGSDGKYRATSDSNDYSDYSYDYEDDYSEGRGSQGYGRGSQGYGRGGHEYGRDRTPPGQYLQGYDYNSGPYGNYDYNDIAGRNGPGGSGGPSGSGAPGVQGGGYRHPNGQLFDYRSANSDYSDSNSDYSDFNNYEPYKYYEGSHSRAGPESSSGSGYGSGNNDPYSQEHFYY